MNCATRCPAFWRVARCWSRVLGGGGTACEYAAIIQEEAQQIERFLARLAEFGRLGARGLQVVDGVDLPGLLGRLLDIAIPACRARRIRCRVVVGSASHHALRRPGPPDAGVCGDPAECTGCHAGRWNRDRGSPGDSRRAGCLRRLGRGGVARYRVRLDAGGAAARLRTVLLHAPARLGSRPFPGPGHYLGARRDDPSGRRRWAGVSCHPPDPAGPGRSRSRMPDRQGSSTVSRRL